MINVIEDLKIQSKKTKTHLYENIKSIIEQGLNFEKNNNIKEAIKSYEKALSMNTIEKKDDKIFQLYIKLGELYQILGQLDEGLEYFINAYNIAEILKDKFLEVDALNKIIDSYISKGEIEESINYADKAKILLSEIKYIKGKIENSICMSRIFYIKKEFYNARDICNEALRLCGDKYPFYKGRILVTLSELYKDLTGVEEHLELLRQAYECFEKVDYKRGMLGVINNLAFVYGDKLQDYEKTLECLMKLKELSKNSIFVEFNKISNLNLGEVYLKCFKYDEALYWFNEALKNPVGAYMDNILVYNYACLFLSNLRLYNYKEAYDFFIKAREEVTKNSSVESTLVQYNKMSALLFIEFGQFSKARSYIKKALDTVGKEETIIKWNVGFVYEFLKLSEAKNDTDIVDNLEGIRYTLSKYKNKDEILDAVYDIAIELITMGYYDLAFNFIEEYNSIKSDNDSVKLKKMFIDLMRNGINNYEDKELLVQALEIANQTKNRKIQWKLYCLLGDYYFKNADLSNAIRFYEEAYDIVRNFVISMPEEFRLQFVNINKLFEPYHKLNIANKHTDNANNDNIYASEAVIDKEQLNEIFMV